MNSFIMVVLEFLNHLTLGALGRCGEPDPTQIREELQQQREEQRLALARLMGKIGVVATPLRPTGKVALHGTTYDATSEGGFIDRGEEVEVVGGRGTVLVVRARPSAAPVPKS